MFWFSATKHKWMNDFYPVPTLNLWKPAAQQTVKNKRHMIRSNLFHLGILFFSVCIAASTFGTDAPRTCSPIPTVKVKNQMKAASQYELQGNLGWNKPVRWLVWSRQSPESWGDRRNASVLDRFIAVIIIETEITSLHPPLQGSNRAFNRGDYLCLI